MIAHSERTSPSVDSNFLVSLFLDGVGRRPVPLGAETRLEEIREAIAKKSATIDMAIDIIRLFPNDKVA
jgi:hypothetical protein